MPSASRHSITALLVVSSSLLAAALPAVATCGGGGGGGMGGATPGGSMGEVYHVPWKILGPGTAAPEAALTVFWFPTGPENARGSDLLTSRFLALTSSKCVGMDLITNDNGTVRSKYAVPTAEPLAVLSSKDGTELGRVAAAGGKLRVEAVEDLLRKEIDKREAAAKEALDSAKKKADQKDAEGAATLYTQVWDQRCLLPGPAKKAAKALKKLGKPVAEEESRLLDMGAPDLSEPHGSEVVRTMQAGLSAEQQGRLGEAERLYAQARTMDPGDPVPVRFLGELYRHHIGDWDRARDLFHKVLAMPADDVSRAVALHGLGKMTIHDGDFKRGLALFEESLEAYPLALTYRNLAVYWNSAKETAKAYEYVKKAIDLDPDDEYNQIFAATYLVEMGRQQDAEEIARRHEQVLAASYNLAVIYAHLGNKTKTLELLRRHFFVYEQFEAVRMKEMQEARDDIAFAPFLKDPDFVKLTALADSDASSYHRRRG